MRRRTTQGSLTQLTRRLAAYIPTTLAARILEDEQVPEPGDVRRLPAATLFCDLSGFTPMTSELAKDGPRGAEALSRILLMTFTVMINAIHTSRGAVVHFYGDAMLVYFPDDDGEAATRALSCARFMQSLMQRGYSEVTSDRQSGGQSVFHLAMKIGVGYGSATEVVVGHGPSTLEFVLGGSAVTEAVTAQTLAGADQVIASRTVLQKAGLPAEEPFRQLTEVMPVPYAPPILYLNSYDSQRLRLLVDAGARFMHPALPERIMGERASSVAEHRPVTSLFVQFEGIDFEAPDAGARLQEYYEWAVGVVARFGGENSRLNRVLTGDKGSQLHIIYGAPVAPDAPVQALRCALALQREKPAFIASQRVGVAAGNVFAGAVGSGARREYTIIGETVNLSSRLATFCPPGEVVIDDATARRASDHFEFEELDPTTLKGFATPVPVRRVLGERAAAADRHRLDTQRPLIRGRARELQTLRNVLDATVDGFSNIVAIAGPVGVGRSRLLAAAMEHWRTSGGTSHVGVAQVQAGDAPFAMWLPIWREFFQLNPDLELEKQARRVVDQVRHLCPYGSGDVGLWVEALGLPVPAGAAAPRALTPDARRNRFFLLVRRTLEAAALHNPLLLAFEDVHYADPLSLALLDTVATQWGEPTLLIATTFAPREGFAPAYLELPNCTLITLKDLRAEEGRQLAADLLGVDELPASLIAHLGLDQEATRINPAFIEESIHVLQESGILRRERELTLDEVGLAAMRIPDSINSLLLARLDRVSATARTVLQAASVVGRQFDLRSLRHAVQLGVEEAVENVLMELEQAQMIYQVSAAPEPAWLFRNDMTREVVYQSIPYARRQTLHAAIAEGIRADFQSHLQPYYGVLAHHYGQTDLHEHALHFALAVADEAATMFASQSAVELYTLAERHLHALGTEENWSAAVRLYLSRAEMQQLAGNEAAAGEDAERALSLALTHGQAGEAARACNLLGEMRCRSAPGDPVLALANRVVHHFPRPIPRSELGRAWVTRGEALAYLGHYDQARSSLEMARILFADEAANLGRIRLHVVHGSAVSLPLNVALEARHHLEAARALLADVAGGGPEITIRLALSESDLALARRDLTRVEERLNEAEAIIAERELAWWRPALLYRRARLWLAREVRAEAHATLHLARMAVQNGGSPDELPLILLLLADLTGRSEQADGYLRACVHACRERAPHAVRAHCLSTIEARRAAS